MDPNQPYNQPNTPTGGVVMPDAAQPAPVAPPQAAPEVPQAVPPTPQMPPLAAMPAFMQPPDPVMQQVAPEAAPTGAAAAELAGENPDKSYLVALLLSYFLGSIGADRFYLGKTGSAIAKLLTLGGLGIWQIIDVILVAFGKLTAKDDPRPLAGFAKEFHWVKILAIILITLNAVVIIGFIILVIVTTVSGIQGAASGV